MMNIQQAKELKQSLMWAGVVEELDKRIHFETTKLFSCLPEELSVLQASIQAYQRLKTLPDDIIDRES